MSEWHIMEDKEIGCEIDDFNFVSKMHKLFKGLSERVKIQLYLMQLWITK